MQSLCALRLLALLAALLGSATGFAQSPDPTGPPPSNTPREDTQDTPDGKPKQDSATEVPAPTGARSSTGAIRFEEFVVEEDQPLSAASSQVIHTDDYALRPHSTTQEILNHVPGLVVIQHQGGGKAVQYLIRGFDADHGTDFALFTDGIPVNMVTHAHGQGYADINYLIPETVRDLQLYKGPYFVELGDFSLAGALKIETKDEFQQNFALAEGGSFDTQRYVLGGSVPLSWAKTLLAAEVYNTNGPFENPQHYWRYNVFAKLTAEPTADYRLSLLASVYAGDWDGSGQIPARVVGTQPGDIGRFGSLDASEGGNSDRENLSLQWRFTPTDDEQWSAQLWGSHYHLRLFSDFTFFRDSGLRFYVPPGSNRYVDRCAGLGAACPDLPDPTIPLSAFIPGDGIEQDDERLLWGGFVQYSRFWTLAGAPGLGNVPMQTELGFSTRGDDIEVSLWRQVRRHRFFEVNSVAVYEQSFSGYWGQQVFLADRARLSGGMRGDVYVFSVGDRLPRQSPDANFVAVPIHGHAVDGLASPKLNLILGPWYDTEYYLNFGYGFHSNDARSVVLTGASGLAQGYGYEIGARTRQFDRLDAAAALWLLDLDSELVFSGDGGNVEAEIDPITGNFISGPASRRWGVDVEARYQITDWLYADYDLTWADPRFRNGDAIPLAPTLVMNGGLTLNLSNGLAAALRWRYLGNRPANESRTLTAQGYALLDLLLRYRWRNLEASLALLNLTDTDWREAQFAETTCVNQLAGLDYDSPPGAGQPCPAQGSRPAQVAFADGIDGVSFTPGNPFAVRAGLQIFF